MISEKVKLKNKNIKLFLFFFVLYSFFGLCISYLVTYDVNDIFFGSDSYRVFLDLTDITFNHYRIKVHPLFLLIAQPIIFVVDGIVNNPRLSIIIIESIAGALSVVLVWKIFGLLCLDKKIRDIASLMYGFCFSIIIYSSIPETFIFAGLELIFYWYFVYLASNSGNNSKAITIIFIITGVISFGITLTNYVTYCIGLIYYLSVKGKAIDKPVQKFVLLNIVNCISIIVLCIVQKISWIQSPIFIESIIMALLGLGGSETDFMNWGVNINKTFIWFRETILYPIVSPSLYLKIGKRIHFDGYSIVSTIAIIIFITVAIFALYQCFKSLAYDKNKNRKHYIIAISSALMWNLLLHYIYGTNEAFMYSPHYIYFLFILIAYGINCIKLSKLKKAIQIILLIFCCFELMNNIYHSFVVAKLALGLYKLSVPWFKVIGGTLLLSLICYIFCWLVEYRINLSCKKKIVKENDYIYKRIYKIFIIYGVIIATYCIFLSFNYNGLSSTIKYYWNGILKLKNKFLH